MAAAEPLQSEQEKRLLCCTGVINEILDSIAAGKDPARLRINGIRSRWAKQLSLASQPKLVDLIAAVPPEHRRMLNPLLLTKPTRSASGVAVIAVMCKPHRCPHIAWTGNVCVYCPGGPDSDFEYSTQSYTGYEPTSMRAIRARYDPYEQARGRLEQLRALGHSCDKVEYIIMGGTFMSLPEPYRNWFISRLHDALSGQPPRAAVAADTTASRAELEESVRMSEASAVCKCVGITIETRPDYCLKPHLSQMLSYGCTRLEIGVQSVYEDVARDTNRGHTVRAVCESFELAKDAGYKVVAHMMPDLPNVGMDRDLAQFREYFENPRFRSDGLKIYPTLVIRGTGLYELWRSGRYRSYEPNELVDLVAHILALVPPWTRVYRVQRDIPMPLVSSGVEHGNLRELADARLRELGSHCRDVRSREIGISAIAESMRQGGADTNAAGRMMRPDDMADEAEMVRTTGGSVRGGATTKSAGSSKREKRDPESTRTTVNSTTCTPNTTSTYERTAQRLELIRRDYAANGGWETFLAYEDPEADVLVGMLRLRRCSPNAFRPELLVDGTPQSIVRELHVYGSVVPIHSRDPTKFQHQGLGRMLMEEAERIARSEHGSSKIAVISGVGTRNYYRKLGYESEGPYMVKSL